MTKKTNARSVAFSPIRLMYLFRTGESGLYRSLADSGMYKISEVVLFECNYAVIFRGVGTRTD